MADFEFSGKLSLDEKARKQIEKLFRANAYTIYVELNNTPEPVAVAEIKKCDNCPDWLFDKVIKQILGNGEKGK